MNYNLVPLRQVVSEVESDCENPSLGEEHISGVATGEELQERMVLPQLWWWDGIYPPKKNTISWKKLNKINENDPSSNER